MDIRTVVSLFEIALGGGSAVSCAYLFINVPDARRFSESVDLSGVLCLEFNIPAW